MYAIIYICIYLSVMVLAGRHYYVYIHTYCISITSLYSWSLKDFSPCLAHMQYVVEEFSDVVFLELLNYAMVGACTIKPANVVGLACAAEHYEIEALRQVCHEQLPKCLSVACVCEILGQLEKHLAFSAAKTMIVQSLEFVDSNAHELLASDRILGLSENMVHLVLRRDTDVPEILKVKAAFSWGKVNAKPKPHGE